MCLWASIAFLSRSERWANLPRGVTEETTHNKDAYQHCVASKRLGERWRWIDICPWWDDYNMTSDDEMIGSENVSSQICIELFGVGRTGLQKLKLPRMSWNTWFWNLWNLLIFSADDNTQTTWWEDKLLFSLRIVGIKKSIFSWISDTSLSNRNWRSKVMDKINSMICAFLNN